MNLYIAHVGFYQDDIGIYELHTNFFVAAEDAREAKQKVKAKAIFKERRMHIDGIEELSSVDGYQIVLEAQQDVEQSSNRLDYDQVKSLD